MAVNINAMGWVDTWALSAKLFASYRDQLVALDPLDPTLDTFVVDERVRSEWRGIKAFLTKMKAAAQPVLRYTPVIGPVAVRRHNPGCTPWASERGLDVVRLHTCLSMAPGAVVYAGGDSAVLAQGVVTWVNHQVPHCWANFGEHPMIELAVELRKPDAED